VWQSSGINKCTLNKLAILSPSKERQLLLAVAKDILLGFAAD
jgi:hypothetical protein